MNENMLTHADLSRNAIRPPGMPESECDGQVVYEFVNALDADGAWGTIVDDDAQGDEGPIGERVPFAAYHCHGCGHMIPTVTRADGKCAIRNEYAFT